MLVSYLIPSLLSLLQNFESGSETVAHQFFGIQAADRREGYPNSYGSLPQDGNKVDQFYYYASGSDRIERNLKKYQCSFCEKSFVQPSLLKRHVRGHTGEKPYSCPYCPHSASQKENLAKHMVTHRDKAR